MFATSSAFSVAFVPYASSAFVPTETMPTVLRAVAENQLVTPIIETARELLLATPVGDYACLTLTWCAGILLFAIPTAAALFHKRTST